MATQTQQAVMAERPRHRFTVNDYHRMNEIGMLTPDDKVELIEGEVVKKGPMNPKHAASIRQLTRRLERVLGDSVTISTQLPLAIPEYDEPEPDIAVLQYREDEYVTSHPTPADVLLVIEVSDSSLATDRRYKLPLYARAGIAECWIVDITRRGDVIERHTDPEPESGSYRTVERFVRGEETISTVLPELSLTVAAVLGLLA